MLCYAIPLYNMRLYTTLCFTNTNYIQYFTTIFCSVMTRLWTWLAVPDCKALCCSISQVSIVDQTCGETKQVRKRSRRPRSRQRRRGNRNLPRNCHPIVPLPLLLHLPLQALNWQPKVSYSPTNPFHLLNNMLEV